jgi:hypothetical protein
MNEKAAYWAVRLECVKEALERNGIEAMVVPTGAAAAEAALAEIPRGARVGLGGAPNAITDDGKIVNTDGLGNRLAAFCFGPGKVIVIAGRNKITCDLDAAMERVRNVAAPINARRFGLTTPCVETGKCTDCDSPERICNLTLIIEKQHTKGRMKVILVNEDLGY